MAGLVPERINTLGHSGCSSAERLAREPSSVDTAVQTTDRGAAAPPAYRLAAGRLLSVDGAGLGPPGCCREAALATDRSIAQA